MKAKKILCGVLVAGMLATSSVSVFAAGISASEQKILDALNAPVTYNGQTYKAADKYPAELKQAKDYLLNNDVSDKDAAAILSNVIAAREDVGANGFTKAVKDNVLSYASKSAAILGLKIVYDANGKPVVKDAGGVTVGTTDKVIKKTGADVNTNNAMIAGAALAGIIALAGYAIQKNKLTDK